MNHISQYKYKGEKLGSNYLKNFLFVLELLLQTIEDGVIAGRLKN
jgi:hypothetical protein